jgi:hypothetical protein
VERDRFPIERDDLIICLDSIFVVVYGLVGKVLVSVKVILDNCTRMSNDCDVLNDEQVKKHRFQFRDEEKRIEDDNNKTDCAESSLEGFCLFFPKNALLNLFRSTLLSGNSLTVVI